MNINVCVRRTLANSMSQQGGLRYYTPSMHHHAVIYLSNQTGTPRSAASSQQGATLNTCSLSPRLIVSPRISCSLNKFVFHIFLMQWSTTAFPMSMDIPYASRHLPLSLTPKKKIKKKFQWFNHFPNNVLHEKFDHLCYRSKKVMQGEQKNNSTHSKIRHSVELSTTRPNQDGKEALSQQRLVEMSWHTRRNQISSFGETDESI